MSNLGNFSSVGPVAFTNNENSSISHVTADSAKAVAELGARRTYKGEDYVYVHSLVETAIGEILVLSAASTYSLTKTTVSKQDLPMCVVKHQTMPAAGYGWGLVRGVAEALKIENTAATGVALATGSGSVAISALVGSFPTQAAWAQVLSSGTGTCKAYVKCFG